MNRNTHKRKIKFKTITLICLSIFFLTISVGYSYLQTQVKIEGKATITAKDIKVNYPVGKSVATWKITNKWKSDKTNETNYQIELKIVNNDEIINSWIVAFDVPNSYNQNLPQSNSSFTNIYENGRLTLYSKNDSQHILQGEIISIDFTIALEGDEDFEIKNLTLNGLLVSLSKK